MKTDESLTPCPRVAEAPAYCLGEWPASRREEYEKHLADCPACRRAVASFKPVIERLREDPEAECSPTLVSRIASKIQPGTTKPAVCWRGWLFIARAAALFVALGVGLFLTRTHKREESPDTDTVRRNALEWLCQSQGANGGWSAGEGAVREKYGIGVSALALMALMQDRADALQDPCADAIRRGVEYLVKTQNEQGLFGAVFSGATYNQGLATLALLEACALESHIAWRTAAQRAVVYLVSIQDRTGGWDYLRSAPGSANTSASIWPLLALIRADELGFADLRPSIERGLAWLKTTVNEEGRMGYRRANHAPYGTATLTAAGVACLARNGNPADARFVETMLGAVRKTSPVSGQPLDFYRAFFISRALSSARDATAGLIRASLREQLVALQSRSGPTAGSWEAGDRWGRTGGPVYATALAALTMTHH